MFDYHFLQNGWVIFSLLRAQSMRLCANELFAMLMVLKSIFVFVFLSESEKHPKYKILRKNRRFQSVSLAVSWCFQGSNTSQIFLIQVWIFRFRFSGSKLMATSKPIFWVRVFNMDYQMLSDFSLFPCTFIFSQLRLGHTFHRHLKDKTR